MNDPRSHTLSRPTAAGDQDSNRPPPSSATDTAREQDSVLAQLEAASPPADAAGRSIAGFVRAFYDTASLDALRQRSPDELLRLAHRQRGWTEGRAPGELRLRLLPPGHDGDALPSLAVIETCIDDMPYLVDTVAIAVREAGVSIDWAVHPILTVRRDGQGRIAAIGDALAGDADAPLDAADDADLLLDAAVDAHFFARRKQRVVDVDIVFSGPMLCCEEEDFD